MSSSTNYKGKSLPILKAEARIDRSNPLMPLVPARGQWPPRLSALSRHQNNRIWLLSCPELKLKVKAKSYAVADMKLRAQIQTMERLYIRYRLAAREAQVRKNVSGQNEKKSKSGSRPKRKRRTAYH